MILSEKDAYQLLVAEIEAVPTIQPGDVTVNALVKSTGKRYAWLMRFMDTKAKPDDPDRQYDKITGVYDPKTKHSVTVYRPRCK